MINKDDLIGYFSNGEKAPGNEKIGTEHEKFVYSKKDLSLVPYDGEQSIIKIFDRFINLGWKPIKEQENIIALKKNEASITLEPGGQLELSGAPLDSVHETCIEINNHLEITKSIEEELNIGFLGIGFLPDGSFDSIPRIPKKRYSEIMTPYMKKLGGLGLEMMYQTCTVQANFDFTSEEDMRKKVKIGTAIQPIVTGLFANSPFKDGKLNGFQSYRSFVWSQTDENRTGLLSSMLQSTFSYEEYVDYVLNVPTYFIVQDGSYIDCTEYTFKEIMAGKFKEINPEKLTLKDWETHVSTIFTEVRLKSYIEMRGADAGGYKSLCALPALWTGLIYCNNCIDEVMELTNKWTYEEINGFKNDIAKIGLHAKIDNQTGWDIAKKLLDSSSKGLSSRSKTNSFGDDETIHLDYLFQIVDSQESLATKLIKSYINDNNLEIAKLFKNESF
tara:strand:+ start:1603 stop:2937 length:1335 start_codon:yes stop_codon:yes gene_type:complete